MKKIDIEKQLKNELHQATPAAFDELWKKCETVSSEREKESVFEFETVTSGAGSGTQGRGGKRLLTTLIALFSSAVLALVGVWGVMAGWFDKNDVEPMGKPTIAKGYFILDINPSVEVDYDEEGLVREIVGLNADGKVLVYGIENELIGESYEVVIDELFDRCVMLGYFSATSETNAVLVSATKQAGGSDETMAENVRNLFSKKFVDKKLCGVALAGKDDPAVAQQAAQYGIDSQKFTLIQEYLSLVERLGVESEISEEEYGEISIREIYEEMEELEELKIGDKASDSIEDVLEKIQDALETEIDEDVFEEMEALTEELERAKSFEELGAIAQPLLDWLQRLELRVQGRDKEIVRNAQEEVRAVLAGVETDKEKWNKPIEETFKEREEKHKDNFDKESEEPEGGFEAWQDRNKEHFENDWQGKKEDWKDRFDD